MLYNYKVVDQQGEEQQGQIDAVNKNAAVSSLQERGFVVVSITDADKKGGSSWNITLFEHVPMKDIVIMSRQLSALFEADVSAVKAFTLLSETADNQKLSRTLEAVSQDIKGGVTISQAMDKYPDVFSEFYVNMVKAGEESGQLTDTFTYLAGYLERNYELMSRTRNALIYPAFVIFTFIAVIVLMLTMVIPRLSGILEEVGTEIPIYTKAVIALSDFFVNYGVFLLILVVIGGVLIWRATRTKSGKEQLDRLKLGTPYVGDLFRKLYLSRFADNMNTMLSAGIPVVRALEISRDVIGNEIYKNIVNDALESVKGGETISQALERHDEIPRMMVQMIQVGEESGSVGSILETLARFYKREVNNAVDTLIGLIEPVLIVGLGIAVGFLITSILVPIYNIAGSL